VETRNFRKNDVGKPALINSTNNWPEGMTSSESSHFTKKYVQVCAC